MKKIFLLIFILIIAVVDIYMAKQIFVNTKSIKQLQKIEKKEEQTITESPVKEEKVEEKVEEVVNTEKNQTQSVQPPVKENKPAVEEVKPEEKKSETAQLEEKQKEKAPVEKKTREELKQIPEGYMVANVYVNLRKEPDVNSEIVTVIKKGSTVKIIGKKAKHWKRVLYTSENRVYEGWVDDRFFTIGGAQEDQ